MPDLQHDIDSDAGREVCNAIAVGNADGTPTLENAARDHRFLAAE